MGVNPAVRTETCRRESGWLPPAPVCGSARRCASRYWALEAFQESSSFSIRNFSVILVSEARDAAGREWEVQPFLGVTCCLRAGSAAKPTTPPCTFCGHVPCKMSRSHTRSFTCLSAELILHILLDLCIVLERVELYV